MWRTNLLPGITVGIIALPLSMALAIASGAPPQQGLYTAIIGGVLIAIFGGSRVNISGPTAAFVVILLPITHQFGLGGLVMSGLLAGIILVLMGWVGLGRLIEVVPYPVTVGFTSGIAVVIATLQVKDFLGLEVVEYGDHYLENVALLLKALPSVHWADLIIGALTLTAFILWSRRKSRMPPHLIAITVGSLSAWLAAHWIDGFTVATIGSRFEYVIDGSIGQGIPPLAPSFVWPWQLPGADGQPIGLSLTLLNNLLGPALAIAMLGALESLLCAVVADGMAGTRHDPNRELIGQGIGNIIVPFFGGIPATAAIARTAASIRAGATSPLAAVIHGLFVLFAILFLARLLAYIPMASLAALLLMVAWAMSEGKHFMRIVKAAPRDDTAILLSCFLMTVIFDMTIAVAVGISLAAFLFIRQSIEQTGSSLVSRHEHKHAEDLPPYIAVYDVNGPLFFGAAHKALGSLGSVDKDVIVVILDMSDVTMLDMTAIVILEELSESLHRQGVKVIVNQLPPRLLRVLEKAGFNTHGAVEFCSHLELSLTRASQLHQEAQKGQVSICT